MITQSELNTGDLIDTPYGPGVVLEIHSKIDNTYSLTIAVSGSEYRIRGIGLVPIGHIDLPPEN